MDIAELRPEHVPGCVAVAASLPDWFGYEGALAGIEEATRSQPGFVALDGGAVVGFVTLDRPFEESIEITFLAVQARSRRNGIGRALVGAARDRAASLGAKVLCLLTLGPSSESAPYAETVRFYQAIGLWRTKEVRLSTWGGAPVLLLSAPLENIA